MDSALASRQYVAIEKCVNTLSLKDFPLLNTFTKWLFLFIVLCPLFEVEAQTINAASCSASDVQNALNSVAADGTTVIIPAGNCTWTTPVTYSQTFSTTIQGAGAQTAQNGSDQTIIQDNINRSSSDPALLALNTAAGKSLRVTGIAFYYSALNTTPSWNGVLRVGGTSQSFRMDHVHVYHMNAVAMLVDGWVYGVIDHALFDMPAGSTNNGIRIAHGGWNGETLGAGDKSWADSTTLGSNRFLFIEDSTFNNGAANDCTSGGRFVFRHNTMNASPPAPSVQTHPTGGGARHRGCRAWEIYGNTFNASNSSPINAAYFVSSGTGVIWGNSAPAGYQNFITGHVMRVNNSTYPQSAPPNGWGYCGTTMGPSAWDGNTDSSGYPCIDQLGRGRGDLLVNDFPNTLNSSTGSIAWPHQSLEPIYEWSDAWSAVPNNPGTFWSEYDPPAVQNRDYYLSTSSFNGTSGVGSGLASARPASCTPNVAYWATDTNTLYQCSSANTWTVYYKPYTYPHPLTGSTAGTPPPPSAPSGLKLVVN